MTANMSLLFGVHNFIACWPIPQAVCDFFNNLKDAFMSIVHLISNPVAWLFNLLFPCAPPVAHPSDAMSPSNCIFDDPVWNAFGSSPDQINDMGQTFFDASVGSAVALAGAGAGIRIVKGLYDERQTAGNIVWDNLFRFLAVVFFLKGPLAAIMLYFLDQSNRVALLIPTLVAKDFTVASLLKAFFWNLIGFLWGAGMFISVFAIIIALVFVYFLVLLLGRTAMAMVAFALAPFFVCTMAYDVRNRFCQWWIDLCIGVVVMPLVIFSFGTLLLDFALKDLLPTPDKHGQMVWTSVFSTWIRATALSVGVAWLTGKAISGLTWKHFAHGGVTGAISAASTAMMAIPNMAADIAAAGGAISAKGGGGAFSRLASIPARRLSIGQGGGPATGGGAADAGGGGGGGNWAADAAAGAAASASSGSGPGVVPDLSPMSQASVGSGAGFAQFFNGAIGSAWPQHQRNVATLMAARPDVARAASEAAVPYYLNADSAGGQRAINTVIQGAVAQSPAGNAAA